MPPPPIPSLFLSLETLKQTFQPLPSTLTTTSLHRLKPSDIPYLSPLTPSSILIQQPLRSHFAADPNSPFHHHFPNNCDQPSPPSGIPPLPPPHTLRLVRAKQSLPFGTCYGYPPSLRGAPPLRCLSSAIPIVLNYNTDRDNLSP